jgi:DNA-directed RNA polymerase specialized sigma24 family protein
MRQHPVSDDEHAEGVDIQDLKRVASRLLRIAGRTDIDAEEIVGRVLARSAAAGFGHIEDMGAYLAVAVRRETIGALRRRLNESAVPVDDVAVDASTPERVVIDDAFAAWARSAVGSLDERRRIVVQRVVVDGEPGTRVAADLGCSHQYVYRLIAEAMGTLRVKAKREGWIDT